MTRIRELAHLRKMAEWASIPLDSQSSPEDIRKHWEGHAYCMKWFKVGLLPVAETLLDVARWDSHPGGIANQNLKRDLAMLPKVEREEVA